MMARYERASSGPGGIAAMPSGYGLERPPTIGANDPYRDIKAMGMGQDLPQGLTAQPRLLTKENLLAAAVVVGGGYLIYRLFMGFRLMA